MIKSNIVTKVLNEMNLEYNIFSNDSNVKYTNIEEFFRSLNYLLDNYIKIKIDNGNIYKNFFISENILSKTDKFPEQFSYMIINKVKELNIETNKYTESSFGKNLHINQIQNYCLNILDKLIDLSQSIDKSKKDDVKVIERMLADIMLLNGVLIKEAIHNNINYLKDTKDGESILKEWSVKENIEYSGSELNNYNYFHSIISKVITGNVVNDYLVKDYKNSYIFCMKFLLKFSEKNHFIKEDELFLNIIKDILSEYMIKDNEFNSRLLLSSFDKKESIDIDISEMMLKVNKNYDIHSLLEMCFTKDVYSLYDIMQLESMFDINTNTALNIINRDNNKEKFFHYLDLNNKQNIQYLVNTKISIDVLLDNCNFSGIKAESLLNLLNTKFLNQVHFINVNRMQDKNNLNKLSDNLFKHDKNDTMNEKTAKKELITILLANDNYVKNIDNNAINNMLDYLFDVDNTKNEYDNTRKVKNIVKQCFYSSLNKNYKRNYDVNNAIKNINEILNISKFKEKYAKHYNSKNSFFFFDKFIQSFKNTFFKSLSNNLLENKEEMNSTEKVLNRINNTKTILQNNIFSSVVEEKILETKEIIKVLKKEISNNEQVLDSISRIYILNDSENTLDNIINKYKKLIEFSNNKILEEDKMLETIDKYQKILLSYKQEIYEYYKKESDAVLFDIQSKTPKL